jgi:multidrug efflux pump subunit AcrA (membrane-fusion protein)
MANSTETAAPPSANGELVNRVQQLRLTDQLGTGGARGSNRGALLPWVLCALMAVTWAGVGVRWYKSQDAAGPPGAAGPGPAAKGAPGSTGANGPPQPANNQPAAAPGELVLQLKGTLTPFLQINLSPDDVSGTVTQIFFKEGDRVKKNDVLAKIRDDRYRNDRDAARAALEGTAAQILKLKASRAAAASRKVKAEAAVESANARIVKAQATLKLATLEFQRMQQAKARGVSDETNFNKAESETHVAEAELKVAQRELAAAESEVKATQAEAEAAEAAVRAAEADRLGAKARHDEAERLLKNCTVLAPIDGTILTKQADVGVLVSPMSFNVAAGICQMADLSDLESEIEVREDEIAKVKEGMRCEIAPSGNPSRIYDGRVDRVMPIADDTKNIVKVRVKVKLPARGVAKEEPGEFLKPKMSTVVRVYNAIVPDFNAKKQ